MSKYPTVKLGDLCDVNMGQSPSSKSYNTNKNGLPFFQGNADFGEISPKIKIYSSAPIKIANKGDILFSVRAPIGAINIADRKCCIGRGLSALTPKNTTTHYLYFLLKAKKENIQSLGTGSTFKAINKNSLLSLLIPFHPIEEQNRISKKLNLIECTIHKRKQQLIKLDMLAKSRFIEMFGDVGKDEFGWGLKRLDSCCTINPKKTSETHLTDSLEVSFCPMQYISEKGDIKTDDLKTYNEVKKGFTYFAENDVVFAKITPCMENGKGAIAKNLRNGIGFGSTEFHVLRPNQNMITPEWLYFLMSFQQFRKDAESNMTGSAGQRRVPADFLKKYKVSIPPLSLQYEYKKFLQQLDKSKFRMKMCLKIMSFIRHL